MNRLDSVTVPCRQCGEPVIPADINSPGISGGEDLDPHEHMLRVVVGFRQGWGGPVAQTENVWGYQRHYCNYRKKEEFQKAQAERAE